MATPDFVVIGHVVRDVLPKGWRLGGTTTFAAIQARRLGLSVGVVTRAGPDVSLSEALPEVEIAGGASVRTTQFQNIYDGARRRQRVPVQADALAAQDVPEAWRAAPVVLLGPVCGEVPAGLGALFPRSLVGVSAQGWLRRINGERWVRRRAWDGAPFWSGCDVLFVSDEDVGSRGDQVARWAEDVAIVAVTRNRRGARVHAQNRWQTIDAFPADERDPTGAGDVFAAAFLVRHQEAHDVAEATRFASAASACSIESAGSDGIAGRETIEARMRKHPEIVLR